MEVIHSAETGMANIGLRTPTSRFFAGVAIGGLIEYYFRPSYSYDTDGNSRPFSLMDPGASGATIVPPGSTALFVGALLSLVI
jgi:hypothetical protein